MSKTKRCLAALMLAALLLTGCVSRESRWISSENPLCSQDPSALGQKYDPQAPRLAGLVKEIFGENDEAVALPGTGKTGIVTHFSDMQYTRPDMEAIEQLILDCCQKLEQATDPDAAMDVLYAYYDAYDRFYTDYFLANIHYNCDLQDTYWAEEYQFCLENLSVIDAGLEEMYYAMAKSPIREELESEYYFGEDYFAAYDGESVWDEELLELLEQEAQLQSQYYDLSGQAGAVEYYSEAYFQEYGTQLAELFVELVSVRQQIAREAGYDSYPQYAYDYCHARDYTPQQAKVYLERVGQELSALYEDVVVSGIGEEFYTYCSQQETFDYVKAAAQSMGGTVQLAFQRMEQGGLYDITYGKNKKEGAFELFLWSYGEPFLFLSPYQDQSDKLTFAHEFGHFSNDVVCRGSSAGTDVTEVHSQAMEYLTLLYAPDGETMEACKLADCLYTYVEQAAYALFEQRVYELAEEELTVENVQALYRQIGQDFGFDSWNWDCRDYVTVGHFYTHPMYIVSYVVSNDVAFQIYQLEKESAGAGLEVYEQCLESEDSYLLWFAQQYGLENPLDEDRLLQVRQTLEAELKSDTH